MPRDWDSEWEALIADERAAFDEMFERQAGLTRMFRSYGSPSLDLLDEADAARAAVRKVGYAPGAIAMMQDGNFFNAKKDDQTYQVTVTRNGGVYASGGTAVGM